MDPEGVAAGADSRPNIQRRAAIFDVVQKRHGKRQSVCVRSPEVARVGKMLIFSCHWQEKCNCVLM